MEANSLPWSLRFIVDSSGRDTGFAMLRRGVRRGERDAFEQLAADHRMIGFTHYGPFPLHHGGYLPRLKPKPAEQGWNRPEVVACEAWAHCFRDPDRYLPPDRPRMLISGSDFVSEKSVWAAGYGEGRPAKRWDLVYSCLPTWLNELQKNWDLGKSCALRLADAGVRIVIAGRAGVPGIPHHPNIDCVPQLPWDSFMRVMASARAAFLPNWWDASPCVLTQALALDIPVLVNREILGGWKYVTPETGVFFDDESDVVDAFFTLLNTPVHPRDWLIANGYGQHATARRLAGELRALGGPADLEYALPSDIRKAA
jgi:hypothetical protein